MSRLTTRQKLAKRLADDHDFHVDPSAITGAQGFYRINQRFDDMVVTWECYAHKVGEKFPRHIVSYGTMTECARFGFTLREMAGALGDKTCPLFADSLRPVSTRCGSRGGPE